LCEQIIPKEWSENIVAPISNWTFHLKTIWFAFAVRLWWWYQIKHLFRWKIAQQQQMNLNKLCTYNGLLDWARIMHAHGPWPEGPKVSAQRPPSR